MKLDPDTVEAIAGRVVELLDARRDARLRPLVDARDLARLFDLAPSWVREHADELGAIRIGKGAKPRLRFDPEVVGNRLSSRSASEESSDARSRVGKRREAASPRLASGTTAPLLPIRPPGRDR